MIFSDLQHIESATEIEVQGGGCKKHKERPCYHAYISNGKVSFEFFETGTETCTSTDTLIIEGQFSDSDFNSLF